MSQTLTIDTAKVYKPLLYSARYKGAHGGRGSGKSRFFAELAIDYSISYPGLRVLCGRESQKSLKESAKRLIEDTIKTHQVGRYFTILNDEIKTPGGGVFTFTGLRDHSAESVKSYEGYDIFWGEEAQSLSARSISLIRPTIRTGNALGDKTELWFSWNPRNKHDPVDKMFRGDEKPTGAVCVESCWRDNPWFPPVLEQERLDCLRTNPDQYEHIWEGAYVTVAEGAYFSRQLTDARRDGRIGRVSQDPLQAVRLFADIGGTGAKADHFVFWAAQFCGQEIRALNHYEAQGQTIQAHLEWLRSQNYLPGQVTIWLPHDGDTQDSVYDASYAKAFRTAGYTVIVVPNQGKGAAMQRIEASRLRFNSIWIDGDKCSAGVEALGWYHEKIDDHRQVGLGPDHDWCLAAGTKVLTPAGWRKIEEMSVHDQVLTPYGVRNILRSGIVRVTDQWVTVKGIQCTPEHRFFTSRGLVEAGNLSSRERYWTQESWGLHILAYLCAMFRSGLKTAIISATPEVSLETAGIRSSFIGWFTRMCMAQFQKGLKFIISTITRGIITPTIWKHCRDSSIAATTNQNRDIYAYAASARQSLGAIKNLALGVVQNVNGPITQELSASAAPAYNISVDIDECYFVRGSDGGAYLVSNSSHSCDAFGLMCITWEAPKTTAKVFRPQPIKSFGVTSNARFR